MRGLCRCPAAWKKWHSLYLEAIDLLQNAASEMVKVEADGSVGHLLEAQNMSHHASENLLKVGDVLWPGEHKPN